MNSMSSLCHYDYASSNLCFLLLFPVFSSSFFEMVFIHNCFLVIKLFLYSM